MRLPTSSKFTSKEKYLEAKRRLEGVFTRPNVRQKEIVFKTLCGGMISKMIWLRLSRGWSKLMRILFVNYA